MSAARVAAVVAGASLALAGCIDIPELTFKSTPDAGDDARISGQGGQGGPGGGDALSGGAPGADARALPPNGDASPRPDADRPPERDAAPTLVDAASTSPPDARLVPADALPPTPDLTRPPEPDAARPPLADAHVGPVSDAAAPDAAVQDAVALRTDAARPDAALPDAALPDAAVPDAALPDAALPDAALPDAAPPPPDLPVHVPPEVQVLSVPAGDPGRRFGLAVAVVPDQNGDGSFDVIVGAPRLEQGNPRADTSALFLLDGRTGAVLQAYQERDEPTSFGSQIAAGAFTGDAHTQVIVGAPAAQGGRGQLSAFTLPNLALVDTLAGGQGNAALGSALALTTTSNGRVGCLAGSPGAFTPQVSIYVIDQGGPVQYTLARDVRINPAVDLAYFDFGQVLASAPPHVAGRAADVIAVATRSLANQARRIMRFAEGSPGPLVTEYLPAAAGPQTGASLLVAPSDPPVLLVGDPGAVDGVVSVFPRDTDREARPEHTLVPPAGLSGYGTSMALSPALDVLPGGQAFGVCVGAPGGPDAAPAVECRALDAAWRLPIVPAVESPGFGTSLAGAPSLDPDGTWLLVVGAPDFQIRGQLAGSVHLVRVTPGR